jgi:hypothetical protein
MRTQFGGRPANALISMTLLLSFEESTTTAGFISFGGQVTSLETHPRHFTTIVDPNDALFAHDPLGALSLRAAASAAKKRSARPLAMVNGLGPDVPEAIEAVPSERTTISVAGEFVEPEFTMTALSTRWQLTRTMAA